jgi:hypothetical protein
MKTNWTKIKILRKEQLELEITDVYSYNTVLYIGARIDRADFLGEFQKNNYRIDILEIYKPNLDFLRQIEWINNVIEGDVQNIESLVNCKYDIIFWWHGPEHIDNEKLEITLNKLKKFSNKLVICGCPWGIYKQGEIKGNFWETHLSSLYPINFEKLNFKTKTLGEINKKGSNILAWFRN